MHSYILQAGDRITADVCGDRINGIIQHPDREALRGAEQQGAEFAYSCDRVWRVQLLADDGSVVCCHRDQCQVAGGAA